MGCNHGGKKGKSLTELKNRKTTFQFKTGTQIWVTKLVQMLATQARENMVAIMDVAMPASSLTGI